MVPRPWLEEEKERKKACKRDKQVSGNEEGREWRNRERERERKKRM